MFDRRNEGVNKPRKPIVELEFIVILYSLLSIKNGTKMDGSGRRKTILRDWRSVGELMEKRMDCVQNSLIVSV